MEEKIAQLQEENEKLKKLNSFKSDVISISAHELRTSLSATKWLLKMCLDGDLGPLSADQSKLLKKAFDPETGELIDVSLDDIIERRA